MSGTVFSTILVIALAAIVTIIALKRRGEKYTPKPYINRFTGNWGRRQLPIIGVVAIIDSGDYPFVGLSAMQMDALGVGRGLVLLQFNGQRCRAKVWNASGSDVTRGAAEVRITNSVARQLGCRVGDEITFALVISSHLPVEA